MNTMVEITDMLGVDYYYVAITFEENALLLEKPKGLFAKNIKRRIELSKVEKTCTTNEKGIDKLSFFYERNWYTFIDFGNSLMPCLKERLIFS
ncbi:hypothetical protein [Enterococcus sp. AZ196]|uniref:hypothetical protein n=1 Tax=Enterococcus sp. AZ196 TaxID=2774659 RepID=UPI003D2CA645